jgi:hypothetical protein
MIRAQVTDQNAQIWLTHKQYINDSADKPQICINTALDMNAEH